ncbi:hypothetical protein CEXT_484291 [Caerostris extrusa]|uniref:Uncharacterized protein n=1 Tax=Caerostris extrusa TaxID=172846 RepID=A0AAV4Y6K9_CAEEX|nr:hypothetical protein CEXT_484291 [Caerostris extrusa]
MREFFCVLCKGQTGRQYLLLCTLCYYTWGCKSRRKIFLLREVNVLRVRSPLLVKRGFGETPLSLSLIKRSDEVGKTMRSMLASFGE